MFVPANYQNLKKNFLPPRFLLRRPPPLQPTIVSFFSSRRLLKPSSISVLRFIFYSLESHHHWRCQPSCRFHASFRSDSTNSRISIRTTSPNARLGEENQASAGKLPSLAFGKVEYPLGLDYFRRPKSGHENPAWLELTGPNFPQCNRLALAHRDCRPIFRVF